MILIWAVGAPGTNHDERVRDGSGYVDLALENKGKYREEAAEEVDGHEGQRYAEDCAVLVDLVELWPAQREQR
jgi:hypothetical protein